MDPQNISRFIFLLFIVGLASYFIYVNKNFIQLEVAAEKFSEYTRYIPSIEQSPPTLRVKNILILSRMHVFITELISAFFTGSHEGLKSMGPSII